MQEEDKYIYAITNGNVSFWHKILLRLKVFFSVFNGSDWRAVIFSLQPSAKRRGQPLVDFLAKKKIIKLDKEKSVFFYRQMVFDFGQVFPIGDLISLWSSEDAYLKKNFLENGVYFFEGPYENKEVFLADGDTVVDVGASIGLFSMLAAKKIGSNGQVLAFEPIKEVSELLRKNLSANKIENVRVVEAGLGKEDSVKDFFISENMGISSSVFEVAQEKRKIKIIAFDDFVKEENINRIDFIKADIEGMEREFLAGAMETIKQFKPKISICTYHLCDDKEVLTALIKQAVPGYKIFYTKTKLFAFYPVSLKQVS